LKLPKEILPPPYQKADAISAIVETEEREVECDVLISRFKKLRDQYSADIKRLSFIVDGEEEMQHVPDTRHLSFL
jgi:hypothetical protein